MFYLIILAVALSLNVHADYTQLPGYEAHHQNAHTKNEDLTDKYQGIVDQLYQFKSDIMGYMKAYSLKSSYKKVVNTNPNAFKKPQAALANKVKSLTRYCNSSCTVSPLKGMNCKNPGVGHACTEICPDSTIKMCSKIKGKLAAFNDEEEVADEGGAAPEGGEE